MFGSALLCHRCANLSACILKIDVTDKISRRFIRGSALKTQSDIFNTYNNDTVSFQFLQFFSSSAQVLPNVSHNFFCLKVTTLTSTFHSQKNNHIKLMSTLHTILLYLYCSLLHWGSFTFLLQIRNVIHPKQLNSSVPVCLRNRNIKQYLNRPC